MDSPQITNVLITLLILLVGFIGTLIFKKLDTFEKKIEDILIGDVSHSKDIERLQSDYADHELRITELEKNN